MKRFAIITASVIMSAAFATAVSANDDVTPIELNLDEPIVKAVDAIIAPNPIDSLEKTFSMITLTATNGEQSLLKRCNYPDEL